MEKLVLIAAFVLAGCLTVQAQTNKDIAYDKGKKETLQQDTTLQLAIPGSLREEHEELHKKLEGYTKLPGKTGSAAKALAKVLHPHFEKEEQYALPLLGLLPGLAKGQAPADRERAIGMSVKLREEFEQMLIEHKQIVGSVERLSASAKEENQQEVVRFTEALKLHALTEEEVLYPAAILIGEYLKLKQ